MSTVKQYRIIVPLIDKYLLMRNPKESYKTDIKFEDKKASTQSKPLTAFGLVILEETESLTWQLLSTAGLLCSAISLYVTSK